MCGWEYKPELFGGWGVENMKCNHEIKVKSKYLQSRVTRNASVKNAR